MGFPHATEGDESSVRLPRSVLVTRRHAPLLHLTCPRPRGSVLNLNGERRARDRDGGRQQRCAVARRQDARVLSRKRPHANAQDTLVVINAGIPAGPVAAESLSVSLPRGLG